MKRRHFAMAALLLAAACNKKSPDGSASAEPAPAPSAVPAAAARAAPAPTSVAAGAESTTSAAAAPAANGASAAPAQKAAAATGGSAPDQPIHTQAAAARPKAAAPAESAAVAPAPTAAPAPAPRKVRMVSGSGFNDANFAGSIAAPSPVRSGQTATATVGLSAKAPYHCNDKYPYKFTTDAAAGVSYPTSVVRGMSVAGAHASMGVPFVAGAAGRGTIAGTLSFSVCSADKCLVQKRHVSVTVDID